MQMLIKAFLLLVPFSRLPLASSAQDKPSLRGDRGLLGTADGIGASCGQFTQCPGNLQCAGSRLMGSGKCMPLACFDAAITEFHEQFNMTAYGRMILEKAGLTTKDLAADTKLAQLGASVLSWSSAQTAIGDNARTAIAQAMVANPIDFGALYLAVNSSCPELMAMSSMDKAASKDGVTIFAGMQYELALVLPKFFNQYYFSFGTGDINVSPTIAVNTTSASASSAVSYNVTYRVMTDVCGGVGLDAGFEFGTVYGIALTGAGSDLNGGSFVFDFDAGLASTWGTAVGVMGDGKAITKVMFSNGAGIGGGIGFNGCNGITISQNTQSGTTSA